MKLLLCLCALALPLAAPAASAPERPWNQDVIYFALTDRFYDGDAENNVPAGSDPALYDKTQTNMLWYHGGDFRGLELALQKGYFKDLGVTALWITPPLRNAWCSPIDSDDQPKAGYHGYWTQDFLDIDPHLVSRRSLDGKREYPDSRDGRMQHYKDLVDLAHSQGIKVIQDIVCNHAGPVFFYDKNGDGNVGPKEKEEWIPPFKRDGTHAEVRWAEIAKWNIQRTAPSAPLTILGREVKINGALASLESYGRKGMSGGSLGASNGEEVECDFLCLRDFWTAPGSAHFDKLVDDFVETYAFYLETIGVDGFRIDTVKHVHHAFWDAFAERLRKRIGPARAKSLLLFGEVYDGNPEKMGEYTYRTDPAANPGPCLDSLLNFQFCYAARSYLRKGGKLFGKGSEMETTFRALQPTSSSAGAKRPFYNPTSGLDGLTSAQKMVNFVENHDGLNRFRVQEISERRNLLANALVLTAPGIPCLYYGTEAALEDTKGVANKDGETGRLTFVRAGEAKQFEAARKTPSYQAIASLTSLRRQFPALTAGEASPLWVDSDGNETDDGIFAFARAGEGMDPVIVVINASDKERATGSAGNQMKLVSTAGKPLFAQGDKLERISIAGLDGSTSAGTAIEVQWKNGLPQAEFRVGAQSVNLYRKAR